MTQGVHGDPQRPSVVTAPVAGPTPGRMAPLQWFGGATGSTLGIGSSREASIFIRVFVANALLLIAAALALLVTPVTISAPIALTEAFVVVLSLVVMLVASLVLLRPLFAPLDRLTVRMNSVDLLQPSERLSLTGLPEVDKLVSAFNRMLERLEAERKESGRRALAAQEAERLRIARGLHDEVGQTMTGVLLQLRRVSNELPAPQRAHLVETQQAVKTCLEEVRRISHELRPETLEHLGLSSALAALSTSFSRRTGIPVERRFGHRLPALPPDVELALYRVAQEGLTNAARHANPSTVLLSLEQGDGTVILRIVDDGEGFSGPHRFDGDGLRGIRERALMIDGTLSIKPANTVGRGRAARAGRGVEVRLEVPIRNGQP
jgi:two-component system sensor histidine kinase UhpB